MSAITESVESVEPTKKRIRTPKDIPGITRPMTYEEYLASPEEMARYDIIDGWKVYHTWGAKQLPNPTRDHQEIVLNIVEPFRAFQRQTGIGKTIVAPCDVRITLRPLRCRQPDVLFISSDRLARNPPSSTATPLSPAPELVIEIVSPSDRPAVLAAKLADYRAVGVEEVWVVHSESETVEVIRLSVDEIGTAATYGRGQTVTSLTFPGLSVAVDDIFTE